MVYLPHWPIPSTLGNRKIDYETVFERAKIVLKKLGDPHKNLPKVIHVAGTNGKGSTASLVAKIFQCHGYSTHLYTSPHLIDCNERILLNGQKISDQNLYFAMEKTRINSQNVDLTFMEAFTIGAFVAFAENPADVLVVECGMGARIDITNIIEEKIATIITAISLDHTEYLGDTIRKIAFEKSFLMRDKTPLIVALQPLEVSQILKLIADDKKIPSYFANRDFGFEINQTTKEFDFWWGEDFALPNLSPPALIGNHQYDNFATAIATCMAISDIFSFDYNHINQAIKSVEWKSRIEKIDNNLNKFLENSESEIWIDGAHNEGGAKALSDWILSHQDNKINFVICGFSRKKCQINFLNKFKNINLIAIRVNGEPYPESSQDICEIGKKNNIEIIDGEDLLTALNLIKKISQDKAVRVVICGSLHLARDVKFVNEQIIL
jgi:dihydrofolate synthase/folylpolyglutamate synthase